MVLDDVAGGADAVVVAAAAAESDVLGHGDLHVVDVVGVPDRLVQLVGEPQRQDVLNGLLAQVVVDAEHRLLGEDAVDDAVEFSALCRSWPNGFSMTTRLQRPSGLLASPDCLQLFAHHRERLRRDRQVERVIAAGAPLGVQLVQRLGELLERRVVVEGALHEPDPLGQPVPDLLAERGAGMLLDRVVDDLREILVGPVPPGEPDERERRRQQPAVGQVVDGGHQLLAWPDRR